MFYERVTHQPFLRNHFSNNTEGIWCVYNDINSSFYNFICKLISTPWIIFYLKHILFTGINSLVNVVFAAYGQMTFNIATTIWQDNFVASAAIREN